MPRVRRHLGQALTDLKATPEEGGSAGASSSEDVTAGRQSASARARGGTHAARWLQAEISPRALWSKHRLFTIALVLSLIPRVLEMLGFRPALLTADSFVYMQEAVNHALGPIRPSGYSMFLTFFQVIPHALPYVVGVQHLMGLAIAALVYGLLRYWGLPGWGATLATLPTLFDTREIALESYILPDTLYCLVLLIIVALLITRQTPKVWQCVVAGLLLAYACVLRGNGILLVVIVAAFLLARRVGWRALTASLAALAFPLLMYAVVFHSETGEFNLTASDGIFLWSRTTSFANCSIIKPPADLRPLCPSAEKPTVQPPDSPAFSLSNDLIVNSPTEYLWASDAWWRTDSDPGFNAHNNALGLRFALLAIEKQPLSYLRVVSRDVLLTFIATDRPQDGYNMYLTPGPRLSPLPANYLKYERNFAGTSENTHAVSPFAQLMLDYQQPVYFPGVLFLLIVLAGIGGVARNWRRWGGIQLLPAGLAVVSILSPAFLTQSLYRYAIAAIPLACIAAGLCFVRLPGQRASTAAAIVAAPGAGGGGQQQTAAPPDKPAGAGMA
jgi:hypothetical protein